MATNRSPATDVMKRFAVDSSGRIGSLYDAYRDRVLGQSNVRGVYQSVNSVECRLVKDVTNNGYNLLHQVGIENDVQLSILLNLTPKVGIASLMDHSGPMNTLTRILSFQYVHGEEQVSNSMNAFHQFSQSLTLPVSSTHIVTGVSWGFYMLVILQLPPEEESRRNIDDVLEKISIWLESNTGDWTLDTNEENLLQMLKDIRIHSNVPELTRMTTLCEVCRHISQLKNGMFNYPLTYALQPTSRLYSECTEQRSLFVILPSSIIDPLLKYVLKMFRKIKSAKKALDDTLPKLLGGCLKEQLYDAHQQWLSISKMYLNEVDRLGELLIDCRRNHLGVAKIKDTLTGANWLTLGKYIISLIQNLASLDEKGRVIARLELFKYCNVAERGIDNKDVNDTIGQKLTLDDQRDRVPCTSDVLNKTNPAQLEELRSKLLREYQQDPTLHLIYADFSYTKFVLDEMMTLPLIEEDNNQNLPIPRNISSSIIAPVSTRRLEPINILLLGESGVGKSTFINALANYLTFNSLQTAESSRPIILIPVSFLITVGDHFQEHLIELEGIHKSVDEHFNAFGQSVTQHCQSYVLHLNNRDEQTLRIIDTPGFGDTRGSKQDDRNMQHILEYIDSLTHLNAICFLFKPNLAQLSHRFRSTMTQLFDHLGARVSENIVFCFTNTRTTFYTPGDTAPLLKSMLASFSSIDIPFQKGNTFCFDNESFRYLAAAQKGFSFKDLEKSEYEHSWSMSVKKSTGLIGHISKNLQSYRMESDQRAIKHVQFEITHMVRPILEGIRNILRNVLLSIVDSSKNSIELQAKTFHRLATQCQSCHPTPIQVGSFWILPDIGHEMQDQCLTCSCAPEEHTPMEYKLEYQCSANVTNFDELHRILSQLFEASVEFTYFLMCVARSTKDDPFLNGFNRMLAEEKNISKTIQVNEFNLQLVQQLEEILRSYKNGLDQIKDRQWNGDLSSINKKMRTISGHPVVCEQMNAVRKGQKKMMTSHEYDC